ncbi:hypothetical protein FA13DRAFT_1751902 [Coprinellus micaceus]|uniref:Dickkopf N-terminal cysteine-rich domain-containing protein n=1 Tax=Coprinellus micaceus TaxID=71717 RepID=A0A4Y7TW29_COPMI|nr:hypothetical protein FA13DRAFT_1751902 [Coprinellus micaceus]
MHILPPTLVLLSLIQHGFSGMNKAGEPCSVANNRLQEGTFQFWSECTSSNYCDEVENICKPKRCRRDDFPFGYEKGAHLPDKCKKGQFCPDEGTDCQEVLAVGSPCQLNRDELADTTGRGLNVNGSVCLNNVCQYVENTPYTAYSLSGEFINIVSRGNCRVGLYCDSATKQCRQNKALGEECTADKECDSMNCDANSKCAIAAATPHKFGIYAYVLVALGILAGMGGTLTGLYLSHRKQRDREREKRLQYWREQNAFHQNLMQMRDAARASIMDLPNGSSPRSDFRDLPDDSQGPKASGLRHYYNDDSYDSDDPTSHGVRKMEGRF